MSGVAKEDLSQLTEERNTLISNECITNFMPYLIEGFIHFYGEENSEFIIERINNIIFFNYFKKSETFDEDLKEQVNNLRNKFKELNIEYKDEDFDELADDLCNFVSNSTADSGLIPFFDDDNNVTRAIMLLEMSKLDFYIRLIHEVVHLLDFNNGLSGFKINKDNRRYAELFNEYFTDKIAVDIYNYLVEQGVDVLQDKGKIYRNFLTSGTYYIPDVFMKDFYEENKDKIIQSKFNNSLTFFEESFGKDNLVTVLEGIDEIASLMHIGMSDEDFEKVKDIKCQCNDIVHKSSQPKSKR